jgi:hypothetical protein
MAYGVPVEEKPNPPRALAGKVAAINRNLQWAAARSVK